MLEPKKNWSVISALSSTMLAYSYQQNVFPIFSELKNKTNAEYQKVSIIGLPMTGLIYMTVSVICVLMFGDSLTSSVLYNIGEARHTNDPN